MPAKQMLSISSGLLSADSVVLARSSSITGVMLINPNTAFTTIKLFDNDTEASGNILFQSSMRPSEDTRYYELGGANITVSEGIYVDITGTGAEYIIYYT